MITLRRASSTLRFRYYIVYIDGKRTAKIKSLERLYLDLAPGEHELFLRVDYCISKPYRFIVEKGINTYLLCDIQGSLWEYIKRMFIQPDHVFLIQKDTIEE